MIINTSAVESVLMNKAIPANFLETQIGISKANISRLRNGQRKFDNFSIGTIKSVQKWIDDGNYTFSWREYIDLLPEFLADFENGLFDEKCYIERGCLIEEMQYFPIVDWYYTLKEAEECNATVEETTPERVIKEMKLYSDFK